MRRSVVALVRLAGLWVYYGILLDRLSGDTVTESSLEPIFAKQGCGSNDRGRSKHVGLGSRLQSSGCRFRM